MQNKNILIISSVDWDINWQIPHEISSRLAKSNNVVYVENLGSRSIKIKDLGRIYPRVKKWILSNSGFTKLQENFYIFSPIFIPFQFNFFLNKINKLIILKNIYKWININNISNQDLIVISFLPTPLVNSIIEDLNPVLKIYYCADNMNLFTDNSRHENIFLKKVDHIFYTSESLKTKFIKKKNNYTYLPSGVDLKKFTNYKNVKKINKKKIILGYVGTIGDVFDVNLIYKVAIKLPNCQFIFAGPVYTNIEKLKKLNNIKFLGYVEHSKVAEIINNFDVGLIPYKINGYTNSVNPCKLNEYLAMGKPVFSTSIKEIINFNKKNNNIVYLTNNENDFINNINLIKNDKIKKKQSIQIAKNNSWEKRFKIFIKVLEDNLLKKNKQTYISKFSFYLKSQRFLFIKFFTIFLFIYLIIFRSPLFWYLGEKLITRGGPEKANAIVVFSGNGENAYLNISYQKRVKDILPLATQNVVDKIILSSGKTQTYSEVELMRNLLIAEGIDKEKILMIDQYPKNTYEMVLITKSELNKNNIKKILFITSPYHFKRAELIWKKNAPDIKVINITPFDTQPKEMQWSSNFSMIKVICYEYLSILYNKFLNRI